MDKNSNALNWFEISTLDIEASKKFYEPVFATQMEPVMDMGGYLMSFFPAAENKVGGALIQGPYRNPGKDGTLVYLNANPSLQAAFDRIVPAGGQILMEPTEISPEIGWMAVFLDNQGNAVAMHANKR